MRSFVLASLAVLLCVSVAHAAVGDVYSINFDNYDSFLPLNGQVHDGYTWRDTTTGTNTNVIQIYDGAFLGQSLDPNGLSVVCNATQAENVYSSLTDPNVKVITMDNTTDRHFVVSYDCEFNAVAGFLVGLWDDGIDTNANRKANNESEALLQFGIGLQDRCWRVRGANGSPDYKDTTGMPTDPILDNDKFHLALDVTLPTTGNGTATLYVTNLVTGVTFVPPVLQNMSLGLTVANAKFRNPSQITGWFIREQRLYGGDNAYVQGYNMVDNLKIEVIPEPATLSLLALGGLACISRKRR